MGSSTAVGPDGLNMLHLKHLGPLGLKYITALFNASLRSADIPAIWKQANVIFIPKGGKPISEGVSYRPISLLPPAAKVLEKLLLPYLQEHLNLADHQHGFRSSRSTVSALLPLVHNVALGFNQRKPPSRTVALAVDFSKAFDTVDHAQLIQGISESSLPHNCVRWLAGYLRGRMSSCRFGDSASSFVHIRSGVPQGSVISPSLFNFFVSDYPNTAHLVTSYADDFTAAECSPNVELAASRLSAHAGDISHWAAQKHLTIAEDKTHPTLFTSDTHQSRMDPGVLLNNSQLQLERNPKILGVHFDPHLRFSYHVQKQCTKASSRLRILEALAGTNWGQQKETLIMTYRALIKSVFQYAAPVWYPNASKHRHQ